MSHPAFGHRPDRNGEPKLPPVRDEELKVAPCQCGVEEIEEKTYAVIVVHHINPKKINGIRRTGYIVCAGCGVQRARDGEAVLPRADGRPVL